MPVQAPPQVFSRRRAIMRVATAVCAASLLASLAILIFAGIQRDIAALSEQIVLTVFLESGATPKDIGAAQSDLKTIIGIDSVTLQPASVVKETFVNRFATNIGAVLPDNAFPTALVVRLGTEYRTKERIDSIVAQALGMQSISNVSYRTGFVESVEKRQRQEQTAMWVISFVCVVVVATLLWQSLYRLPLSLQESAGAVLAGVLVSIFIALVLFVNVKQGFAWLEESGVTMLLKIELLGSVSVSAFATILLAVNAVQSARHPSENTSEPSIIQEETV